MAHCVASWNFGKILVQLITALSISTSMANSFTHVKYLYRKITHEREEDWAKNALIEANKLIGRLTNTSRQRLIIRAYSCGRSVPSLAANQISGDTGYRKLPLIRPRPLTRWVNKPRGPPANSNASHRACYRPMLTRQGKLRDRGRVGE